MVYRIARNQQGYLRWWKENEDLPERHVLVRDATADETVLIDQIARGNEEFDEKPMSVAAKKFDARWREI